MAIVRRLVAKTYRDISLSMDINPVTQDILSLTNQAAISNALKNIVLTGLGERPFQPLLGSSVGNQLFELASDVPTDYLEGLIKNSIELNEPRVTLDEVKVDLSSDENAWNVSISYVVTGDPSIFTFTFILEPSNFS